MTKVKSVKNKPTPDDVRRIRERHGLDRQQLGEVIHTNWRCVKNWETKGTEGRPIPMVSWELLLIKLGDDEELQRWFPMTGGEQDDSGSMQVVNDAEEH